MALKPDGVQHETVNVVESRKVWVDFILEKMKNLNLADRARNLPDWSGWKNKTDEEKQVATEDMLSREGLDWMMRGDHRVRPSESNESRSTYHNMIAPFLEQYLKNVGPLKFEKMLSEGKFDLMIAELGKGGYLKPGIDLDSSSISVAASTGSTQTPWQYWQMLKKLDECREVSKGSSKWQDLSAGIEEIIVRQEGMLWKLYGLERRGVGRDGVLMRSQSGTDSMLTSVLCGAMATALMDEGASGGQLSASARHPSKIPIRGGEERKEELLLGVVQKDWYSKLKGLEAYGDANEFEFRNDDGKLARKEQRDSRIEQWLIGKLDEIDQKMITSHADGKYRPSRVVLSVTLGSKTNLGLSLNHLDQALEWRDKYGQGEKQRIVIVVDASQGRLTQDQIQYLLGLGVIIDLTGSKTDEGPMFSGLRYVPNSLVDIFRTETKLALQDNPDLLTGLGEYYTRGDMKALLGEELAQEFPDIPDIESLLKWEGVVQTKLLEQKRSFVENADFPGLVYDLRTSLVKKLSNCGKEKVQAELVKKVINGHVWEVRVLDDVELHLDNPRMNTSVPFRIVIDGKVAGEEVMKWLRDEMGNPSKDGYMVQIGQYVAKAKVDRFAYGAMTESSLIEAYRNSNSYRFIEDLNNRLIDRLTEAMELKLGSLPLIMKNEEINLSLWPPSERRAWLQYSSKLEVITKRRLVEGGARLKLLKSEGVLTALFRDHTLMPVVLMSGKSALGLKAVHDAWMNVWERRLDRDQRLRKNAIQKSNKSDSENLKIESLILAFVDHPFVLLDKEGKQIEAEDSDYRVFAESLEMYGHTQLCVWEMSPSLNKYLEKKNLLDRCTVCSRMPDNRGLTKAEYLHPKWYSQDTWVDTKSIEAINDSYKTKPTLAMIDFFTKLAQSQDRRCAIVRGVGKRAERKDDNTQFLELAANADFLGIHPLLYLTETEIEELTSTHDIPRNPRHWDHLKEAMKSRKCGMNGVFVFDHLSEKHPASVIK